METLVWIYTALFVGGAAINIARSLAEGSRFSRYMDENHPEEWQRLLYQQLPARIILWPFRRGNVVHFIWKSREDFGDPRINLFRHKLRWTFYAWLIYLVGGVLGFALLGLIAYY